MPQITLEPGTPVEVFAAASLAAGTRVAITPLGHGRVEVSESSDFTTYEVIQNDLTGYSRDGLSELWVRAALGSGASVYYAFQTSSKPVIIKSGAFFYNGEGLAVTLYQGPTFTGGTPVSIYGLNHISQVATTVTVTGLDATDVTDPGTQISVTRHLIGNDTTGESSKADVLSTPPEQERIFAPNTTYLYEVTNLDNAAEAFSGYYTWYEGEPDLPLV